MHEIIQRRIDNALDRIEAMKRTEEDLLIAIEILPTANFWVDHEVNVSWTAKSMDEVKAVLKAFAERGMMLTEYLPSSSHPIWKVQGKKVKIRLTPYWFSDDAEGVSCKLVRVGEEVTTTPVYKLMCNGKIVEVGRGNCITAAGNRKRRKA